MKNRVIENVVIISTIIIGTLFFLYALFGLFASIINFSNLGSDFLFPFILSLLGISGYVGLWSLFLNRFEHSLKLTFFLLLCGLGAFLFLAVWTNYSVEGVIELLTSKNEFPENVIFVWFISVSIYYTVLLGRKINWDRI